MAKHIELSRSSASGTRSRSRGRRTSQGRPWAAGLVAFGAAVGFLAVNVIDPYSGATASPFFQAPEMATNDGQSFALEADYDTGFEREGYEVTVAPEPTPEPTPEPSEEPKKGEAKKGGAPAPAMPFVAPNPGSAQAIAQQLVAARGWSQNEFSCLVNLWNRESGWRVNAENRSSGAYGIPQALPGSKMASAGADWRTNPATQVTWGLNYIQGRYGSPCGAWAKSNAVGWY